MNSVVNAYFLSSDIWPGTVFSSLYPICLYTHCSLLLIKKNAIIATVSWRFLSVTHWICLLYWGCDMLCTQGRSCYWGSFIDWSDLTKNAMTLCIWSQVIVVLQSELETHRQHFNIIDYMRYLSWFDSCLDGCNVKLSKHKVCLPAKHFTKSFRTFCSNFFFWWSRSFEDVVTTYCCEFIFVLKDTLKQSILLQKSSGKLNKIDSGLWKMLRALMVILKKMLQTFLSQAVRTGGPSCWQDLLMFLGGTVSLSIVAISWVIVTFAG